MDRMKTFLLYALGILGFMFLSYVLEDGLIENMYVKMKGEVVSSSYNISIEDVSGKASNINGYMKFVLHNENTYANNFYIKIDLFSKKGILAATKYVRISDLDTGDTKNYQVKFKGNDIRNYKISIVDEVPDMTNIINIFGWEVDLTNVFGMDLSNSTIMGVKLTDLFSIDGIKTAGGNAWNWTDNLLKSIPWWGYAIGAGIVIWYLPVRFLF